MKSAEYVLEQITRDLRDKGISKAEAAQLLGYRSKEVLYNIFAKKDYLRPEQAKRFQKTFEYNIDFLLRGVGELNGAKSNKSKLDYKIDSGVVSTLLHIAYMIIISTDDVFAVSAWSALMEGDHESFVQSIASLKDNHDKPFLSSLIAEPYATYVTSLTRQNLKIQDIPSDTECDPPDDL